MIKTIELQNFKSHLHTQLNLDDSRLHALVGPNSSGKTSVLQAVHYLSQLASYSFQKIFHTGHEPEYLVTIQQDNATVLVDGYWDKTIWQASYHLRKMEAETWRPIANWSIQKTKGANPQKGSEEGWSGSLENAPYPLPHALRQAVYLKLVAHNLAKAAYSDEVFPRIEYDGTGMAPTLDYLRNEEPKTFAELQEMLRKVIPGMQEVNISRAKVPVMRQRSIEIDGKLITYDESREMAGQEVVLSMKSGERIPAHAISEGTVITLGLLTVILHPRRPNLILLDDVEQGLHPKAQRELVNVLKEVVAHKPNLQIVFSTHSPYIVDELSPTQVHVLNTTHSGYTIAKRLDEHPDAQWGMQTLTTGEFWDAEGEEWVVAGVAHE
ncbi:MAG: ATP-binding protein [Anaerolinea sp.]|nr:ATP-binding protein [Anaerolinea sp.]